MLAFAGIGVAAYLLALLATMPAAVMLPATGAVTASGGTVWRGEATLAGGDRLSWRWAPLRSVARFGFAADFTLDGPGTALAGRALVRSASLRLDDVAGTADARLATLVAPAIACTGPWRLDLSRVELGGDDQQVTGSGTGEGGICRAADGRMMPLPPLAFTAVAAGGAGAGGASAIEIVPVGQRRRTLARVVLERDGRTGVTMTPAGIALLPFAAR